MEKNLYIDASHPNETRIVLKSDNSIEEYEFEDKNNLNFKNNIYLATVSRVEPLYRQHLLTLEESAMVF
jgi:ribonuclease E